MHFASLDWHVHPLVANEKRPATKNGLLDATTDRRKIAEWWRSNPKFNVGIATGPSRLLVVDFDTKDAAIDPHGDLKVGDETLPPGLRVVTPSGGVHAYFKQTRTDSPPSSAGTLAPGIDIRCKGGYVVAAGSRTAQGVYTPVAGPIPEAPIWLVKACLPKKPEPGTRKEIPVDGDRFSRYSKAALKAECDEVANYAEGGRNHRTNRAAYVIGQLVAGGGLDEDEAFEALYEAAVTCGLGHRESVQTVQSGMKSGALNPRGPES